MEILGSDDEADEVAWTPPGRGAPVRTAGTAGYVGDTGIDRTGIPRRPAAAQATPAELDLGEQAPDLGRAEPLPRHADGPPTGGFAVSPPRLPERADAAGRAPDPRPGLQDPGPDPARVPPPEPDPGPPSLRDLVLGTVFSAEALGLSALVIAFGAISSTVPTVLAFSNPGSGAADQLRQYAYVYGLTGLVVLALGALAISRLRPSGGTAAGRALAGAAVVVGVLLMLLAAYVVVLAGDFPAEPAEELT